MRKLSRLIAGAASVAAAAALVAGTVTVANAAPNDPPKGVTPAAYDIVGVGSNTTEYVMDAFSVAYNKTVKTHNKNNPKLYSYDALPLGVNVPGNYNIKPKAGCSVIARPDGSSAGVAALNTTQKVKFAGGSYQCIDFARSSGGRKPTNPADKPGGIVFVAFAKDAITWAARSAAKGGTNAPKSLNTAQLKAIFTCKDTNWSQVGGNAGKIKVYLPQAGSGTLSTWEKFMGITTLGACVSQAPEENEGTYTGFNNPNAIFIWSIGAYVAEKYHEANCNAKPTKQQNQFGCNLSGFTVPEKISGVSPLTAARIPTINPKFPTAYWRTVYNVVNYWTGTRDHLSPKDEHIFGSRAEKGYICSNVAAQTTIRDYGFVTTGLCGSTS
ncbi:MAG TPA: substrate-binding domain-containing protein [Trebonia sp.]|jgi:ABC-type phosphate transport system substrate-binding protein|nr:substrate-binding domain-containing protein [Trebonia sp.]